jgi:methionine synthase I (cobalamin-dependent)
MAPIGPLSFALARDAFAEQARSLAAGGRVDVLWLETVSVPAERWSKGGGGRRRHRESLPIVCTLSFDTNGQAR